LNINLCFANSVVVIDDFQAMLAHSFVQSVQSMGVRC
jgi:hypothetical protein